MVLPSWVGYRLECEVSIFTSRGPEVEGPTLLRLEGVFCTEERLADATITTQRMVRDWV